MAELRMQEANGADPSGWASSLVQLIGAGGLGLLLRELLGRLFQRADRRDDVAAGLRAEMVRRLETLERNYTALEERERATFRKAIKLESENVQLRRRWHALMNWMQSEPSLPQPPRWLYEAIEGPTANTTPPSVREDADASQ